MNLVSITTKDTAPWPRTLFTTYLIRYLPQIHKLAAWTPLLLGMNPNFHGRQSSLCRFCVSLRPSSCARVCLILFTMCRPSTWAMGKASVQVPNWIKTYEREMNRPRLESQASTGNATTQTSRGRMGISDLGFTACSCRPRFYAPE